MAGAKPGRLALFLIAVAVVLSAVSFAKGGLFIGRHEGDTLHVLQIVTRMAQGQWPHLDFETPIGVLAMAPIALMMKLGLGAGHAILAAQALVAALLLPAIWWVATTRFRGGWAWLFGAFVLVLVLALVHGETERAVSISMHYNRWAWAASYLALAVALLPPLEGPRRPWPEGLLIGAMFSALALIKVTYVAAFLPAVAVTLLARGERRTLLIVLGTGLAAMLLVTLMVGTPLYWLAYLRDLLTVAGSTVRPAPGLPFADILGAPAYLGGTLLALATVILWRQSGRRAEGLGMLLLAPGFFYVTYQNFGNDPQWLALLGFLLVTLAPGPGSRNGLGWDLAAGARIGAVAAFAFALPSAANLAYSPFRQLALDPAEFMPLVPGNARTADLFAAKSRMGHPDAMVVLDTPDSPLTVFAEPRSGADAPTIWRGETWPDCKLQLGLSVWMEAIAADLKASGLTEGKTAFTADLLSSFWLFGAFEPLPGASPWFYGGLPGFENADYLLVPLCPMETSLRRLVLEAVEESGAALTEVRRNEMYVLYARD